VKRLAALLLAAAALHADEVRITRLSEEANNAARAKFAQALSRGEVANGSLFSDVAFCGPRLWQVIQSDFTDVKKEPLRTTIFFDGALRARALGLTPIDLSKQPADRAKAIGRMAVDDRVPIETAAFRKSGVLLGAALAKRFAIDKASVVRRATDAEINYLWLLVPYDLEEPIFTVETGKERLLVNLNSKGEIDWIDLLPESPTTTSP